MKSCRQYVLPRREFKLLGGCSNVLSSLQYFLFMRPPLATQPRAYEPSFSLAGDGVGARMSRCAWIRVRSARGATNSPSWKYSRLHEATLTRSFIGMNTEGTRELYSVATNAVSDDWNSKTGQQRIAGEQQPACWPGLARARARRSLHTYRGQYLMHHTRLILDPTSTTKLYEQDVD